MPAACRARPGRVAEAQQIYQDNAVAVLQGRNPGGPIAGRPAETGKKYHRMAVGRISPNLRVQ